MQKIGLFLWYLWWPRTLQEEVLQKVSLRFFSHVFLNTHKSWTAHKGWPWGFWFFLHLWWMLHKGHSSRFCYILLICDDQPRYDHGREECHAHDLLYLCSKCTGIDSGGILIDTYLKKVALYHMTHVRWADVRLMEHPHQPPSRSYNFYSKIVYHHRFNYYVTPGKTTLSSSSVTWVSHCIPMCMCVRYCLWSYHSHFNIFTPKTLSKPSLPSIMDPSLLESILQAFTETQQWTQQFIVEDSGKPVDLASATIQQASTTPENSQNQPPSYPHRSVYCFDST